jgi:hypothetical protein
MAPRIDADNTLCSCADNEHAYMIYSDDLSEVGQLLASQGIEYSESSLALLSVNSKDGAVITLQATAQRFLKFVSECLSRRRVTVQIRDGGAMRNVELHGYSKEEALEILREVNNVFISKTDI